MPLLSSSYANALNLDIKFEEGKNGMLGDVTYEEIATS